MPNTSIALPPLDLLAHNLVGLLLAIIAVMVLSELVVSATLRVSKLLLGGSLFKEGTADDLEVLRKRVRRKALVAVGLLSLGMFAGALVASFAGLRALDIMKGVLAGLRPEDLSTLRSGVPVALGVIMMALLVDMIVGGVLSMLRKGLARSVWFEARRDALTEVLLRLRRAFRVVILGTVVLLVARTLGLPEWSQRALTLGAYVLGAFHVSRLLVVVGYVVIDGVFERSGRLNRLESPLRLLGSLSHLAGITRRTLDYVVYVGAATWIADQLTPDTWVSQIGRVGIRIIAIFYASRVLVELCAVFLKEIFLGKVVEGDAGAYQRRQTILPVAVGFLRYGIYFTALVMVLRVVDVDPTPLLAGAGVIGVAVGLGAQAFVGDIVAGFFILFEDLILVGDLVEVGGVMGVVEEIGVRITKIRDESGVLHAIPNGEVRKVANHSKVFVNAVVDAYVPYEEDLQAVSDLLSSVARKAIEEATGKPGDVEVNVEELTEGSVLLRVVARVPPGKDKDLGDLMRARIAEELRRAGIGAPRPRRAVLIDSALRLNTP
ncbi:MAG TPA: mechanosensitive ion channel family protein, partial [Candidatus Nanopelagicales bacterium]|nr:mechanosensitive ion channel family protein [Candidatus Nanopelagicales bacterium]